VKPAKVKTVAVIVLVTIAELTSVACSTAGPKSQARRTSLSTSTSTSLATSTTVGPFTTGAPTSAPPADGGLGAPVGTQPYLVERTVKVPPLRRLTGVRAARQNGFDRIVFDFDGGLPSKESVQYVPAITQDGSGAAVPLQGAAFLKIAFSSTEAHGATGSLSFPQGTRFSTGLASIEEVILSGDFEGVVSFGLGLRAKAGFRVSDLTNPARVIIDVAS